jgi:hypothetical protein
MIIYYTSQITNTSNMKFYLYIILTAFISACGGGSSGSVQQATPALKADLLTILSNGQGVARLTSSTTVGLFFTPAVSEVIKSFNIAAASSDSSVLDISPENFPIISTTPISTTRKGTFSSNGTTLNVTLLTNNKSDKAKGIYFEIPNDADATLVGGSLYTIPSSAGVHLYTGTFSQHARSTVAPGQIGSFSLTVDLSLKTFKILGSTNDMQLSGNGLIDTTTGLFATSNSSISVNGLTYTGTLYGNLNDINGSAVSGIFYTNDSIPDFAGSFIGSM